MPRTRNVLQLICIYVVRIVVQIEEASLGHLVMMAAAQLVDWSGKGKPHDRQGPRLGKSCHVCGEMQAVSSPPHGTIPRVEIWRGAWLMDRPIRGGVRVRSKVFQRAIVQATAVQSPKELRTVNLQVAESFSRGVSEDFSASRSPLKSRQGRTVFGCKLGRRREPGNCPIW